MNRLLALLLVLLCACSPESRARSPELIGVARVAIAVVPSPVQCIRIDASGSTTVTQSFDVIPGAGTVLSMGALPLGTVAFSGRAYGLPCASVLTSTTPLYGAAPVTAQVVSGTPVEVTLYMLPWAGGSGVVTVHFPEAGMSEAGLDSSMPADSSTDAPVFASEGGGEPDAAFDPCHVTFQSLPYNLCQAKLKVKRVAFLVLENQSFDRFYGRNFPGVIHGIPWDTVNDRASDCPPDPTAPVNPTTGTRCTRPHRAPYVSNWSGAHGWNAFDTDLRLGRWCQNGANQPGSSGVTRCCDPVACPGVGYRDTLSFLEQDQIPGFWALALGGVLHDWYFEGRNDWSEPNHEHMHSLYAAECIDPGTGQQSTNPMHATPYPLVGTTTPPNQAINCQTSVASTLFRNGRTWREYASGGTTPACQSADKECPPLVNGSSNLPGPPSAWVAAKKFADVQEDGKATTWANAKWNQFFTDTNGTTCGLPDVSWIIPPDELSCHDPWSIADCQATAIGIANAIASGPCWEDTLLVIKWDDWGGFYDHAIPPTLDGDPSAYGFRVPHLLRGKWVAAGTVGHQFLSTDTDVMMIQDLFLDSARMDPALMSRPDTRPVIREYNPDLGNWYDDLQFDAPNAPVILDQWYP